MLLYLVQHGEAMSEKEDSEQRLTDKGVLDVRKVALQAKARGVRVSELFHSPKPRARQTAQLFAELLEPERGIDQSDNLLPLDDPSLWAQRLAGMEENVMLIGHLPFLARMTGLLLCGDREKLPVAFRMGGVVCLKRGDRGWALEWTLVPEML